MAFKQVKRIKPEEYNMTLNDGKEDFLRDELNLARKVDAFSITTDILTFVLAEQTGAATIDLDAHTVDIEVAFETDPAALTPTITVSDGATVSPASETEQDFTNPVTYTVTDTDSEVAQDWTVTVTVAAE